MTSLDPCFSVGSQVAETIRAHRPVDRRAARETALSAAHRRRHPGAGAPLRRSTSPPVGGHAPARRHRDRARQRTGAAHRGRADHGARRHDPVAGPRSAAGPPADAPHHDPADHARPRRRRAALRPRRRDVRRPARRGRPVDEIFRAPRHPYTQALLAALPPPAQERGVAPRDRGPGARPDGRAARLPVRASVSVPRCPSATACRRSSHEPDDHLHRVLAVERDRGAAGEDRSPALGRSRRTERARERDAPSTDAGGARESGRSSASRDSVEALPRAVGHAPKRRAAPRGRQASTSRSRPARCSRSSASRARARARSLDASSRLIDPTAGRIVFDGADVTRAQRAGSCEASGGGSSPCSRTRSARSTRVGPSAGACARRSTPNRSAPRPSALPCRRPARPRGPAPIARAIVGRTSCPAASASVSGSPRRSPVPGADRRGRAGLGARRLGAGAGAEPARRAAARPRLGDPVRRARPLGRPPHQPSRRRDVPGPHRRDRSDRGACSRDPQHPYTQALLGAIPRPDPIAAPASGASWPERSPARSHHRPDVGSTRAAPSRSRDARDDDPEMTDFGGGHRAACHVARARLDEPA